MDLPVAGLHLGLRSLPPLSIAFFLAVVVSSSSYRQAGRQAGGREGNGGDDDELTGSEGEEEDGREAVAVWTSKHERGEEITHG